MEIGRWLRLGVLALLCGPAAAATAGDQHDRLAAVGNAGGGPPPCGADGICNIGACDRDPDCSSLPGTNPMPEPLPRDWVRTSCGGELWVEATDSPIGVAADAVRTRYATFNVAQKAKNPSYFDAHPSGALATGHAELAGFGVTMVQGSWPKAVSNASGRLDDPSLLFFRKVGKDQDDWSIIGMRYSFELARDRQSAPGGMPDVPVSKWLIHEAGYHRSPGNGGFTCATDDDLKKSAFDAGRRIDAAGCDAIGASDLKTREFHLDKKHGRFWATHVWFEPGTSRPAYAETDPWCRQGGEALAVPACAFFARGWCP
jgi:hypothetical protein